MVKVEGYLVGHYQRLPTLLFIMAETVTPNIN